MCGNLHLEAYVVICCGDCGNNEPAPSKAWHMPHVCIWQASTVYPKQVSQPVWLVGNGILVKLWSCS